MDCFVKAVPIAVSKIPERIERLEGHAGAYANVLFCKLYLHLAGIYFVPLWQRRAEGDFIPLANI
jgi:hypothetical protein